MKTLLKLIPKTLRSKNKLQNKTNLWEKLDTGLDFWNDKDKICIQEVNPNKICPDLRWVHPKDDPDFDLEIVL